MPVNYYPNATEEELVALAESVQRRKTTGETNFVTVAGGGQMQRAWQNTKAADVELRQILYALHKINPDDYENPYTARIRRTRPDYSFAA